MNKSKKPGRHPDKQINIAIMGATSHIAKGLINNFIGDEDVRLFLFARNADPVYTFLKEIVGNRRKEPVVCEGYKRFSECHYDAIINCVGLGTVSEEPHIYTSFFMVTEEFDNLVISYLKKSLCTLYINFSSGAVYGREFPRPVKEDSLKTLRVNGISKDDYFTIAKLNSEAKHRAFKDLNIIDIRVFSYFSRFVDITGKYFMTELIDSILHGKVFHTSELNIVRDYIHPDDLFAIIKKCLKLKRINTAFDAFSLRPVQKREILEFFASHYNLKYRTDKSAKYHAVTGQKSVYYSLFKKARELGYRPQFSSMETLQQETKILIQRHHQMRELRAKS